MMPSRRRRKIALVFEFATLNGGERSMLAALDGLRDEFEFYAVAPDAGKLADELQARSIRLVPLQLTNVSGARLPRSETCRLLVDAIARCRPDVVHANSLAMGRLTGAVADRVKVPTVAHLRDILKLSRSAISDLNSNRLLLAVSQATQAFHVAQGLDADRVRVIHNGVDCRQFQPRHRSGSLHRELDLSEDCFLAATIGQIGLRKGHDILAAAAALLVDRAPNLHFVIVGERHSAKAESVDFEREVKTRFRDAGLASRVHWLGYRDDVPSLLDEVDLLIHPSHQEPLGRVLLEAAAAGTAIVATDVGGTAEILTDGESARLVPPADPIALADAVYALYGDADLRSRFAFAARQRVEEKFNIERTAPELAVVWREVIARSVP